MGTSTPDKTLAVADDWFVAAFGELYPVVYAHRTVEAAIPEAHFAAEAVRLLPEDNALDLCCGAGRHLVTLEQYGAHLAGVDYSTQLLAIARKRLSPETALIHADMRALPLTPCFDVVFSFFTSFGYFEDTDNVAAAASMAQVLKPSGRFFMDYLNPLNLEEHLEPETLRESKGYVIHERRWIDREKHRVNKTVAIEHEGNAMGVTSESVRLYALEELTALLSEVGLQVQEVWGNCAGAAYGPNADRMILAGSKVGA